MPTMSAKIIHTSISRPFAEVAAFVCRPQNMPLWASGLADGLQQHGKDWIAHGQLGDVSIRFAPENALGVADHDVTLPTGQVVHNPLRVVANGDGAEVMFTLFRQPGMSDEQYAGDAAHVEKDLKTLKGLLESATAA
ncbi:SRPBCC family protein [Pararhizobium sp.]|uniref:SRPBCC family protein n=1 Tax=Pararhizobium sp. TaxID=1977563 RepID=UPI002724FA1C|nr:SRPBCC family protein [Pararhizobium sp.]MDO9418669.1 SRPBCC family protein [Pararhizobium sp.]